ncbi:MAG: biotin carboxylase N-terminal domain-containing protein, partial [Bacteroidota bacterium]
MQTKQIDTILIANRGEIASRIIRTCKKMGIRSIAIFSDADKKLPYVMEADNAIYIGASEPSKSYLNQEKIIQVAKAQKADAIHPGYGFLSENADFARKCSEEGIIFIGPNVHAIEAMGSKAASKQIMMEHQVPVIPGYQGQDQSDEKIIEEATQIGYPILLKATAGGGGKGMRIVHKASELTQAIHSAKRESQKAFGNDELIVEK